LKTPAGTETCTMPSLAAVRVIMTMGVEVAVGESVNVGVIVGVIEGVIVGVKVGISVGGIAEASATNGVGLRPGAGEFGGALLGLPKTASPKMITKNAPGSIAARCERIQIKGLEPALCEQYGQ
jgi:hypothetical protein